VPVANVAKALFALQHAGLEGRMRITFELFDSDRSGRIDLQELYEILRVRTVHPGQSIRRFRAIAKVFAARSQCAADLFAVWKMADHAGCKRKHCHPPWHNGS